MEDNGMKDLISALNRSYNRLKKEEKFEKSRNARFRKMMQEVFPGNNATFCSKCLVYIEDDEVDGVAVQFCSKECKDNYKGNKRDKE